MTLHIRINKSQDFIYFHSCSFKIIKNNPTHQLIMEQIVAVEFSLDRGMTWQTLDTSDSDPYAWVHWTLTYTPQMPGSYTLTVRAVSESGMVSPLPHEMLFTVR